MIWRTKRALFARAPVSLFPYLRLHLILLHTTLVQQNTEPFYKLSLDMADTAEVTQVVEGHWALAFVESSDATSSAVRPREESSSSFAAC